MYARLLAFVCLLSCSVLTARAEPMSTRGATVGVYLQVDANASSLSLHAMRLELRDLMAPTGLNFSWTNAKNSALIDRLIVVELRGQCSPDAESSGKFKDRTPLASTAVTDGKVLPFTWVDCNALNRFLRPELEKSATRDEVYGRAIARLLAHEFFHVLTESESHTKVGVSKPSFSTKDLMASSFSFEADAVAQLHIEQPAPVLAAIDVFEGDADLVEETDFAAR